MKTDVFKHSKLVSAKGGTLEVLSDDGEVMADIKVPGGIVDAAPYFGIVPPGGSLFVKDGLAVYDGAASFVVEQAPGAVETAAVAFVEITSATRAAREMERMMAEISERQAALQADARAFHAARIETMPKAASEAAEEASVVE